MRMEYCLSLARPLRSVKGSFSRLVAKEAVRLPRYVENDTITTIHMQTYMTFPDANLGIHVTPAKWFEEDASLETDAIKQFCSDKSSENDTI